jgi:uncharacterized protein (TIGR02145 family)
MKLFRIVEAFLIALLFVAMTGCSNSDDEDLNTTHPAVTTRGVSSVTGNAASVEGAISSNGGETITGAGICYSTNQNPTISDDVSQVAEKSGSFVSILSDLETGVTYYARAYATNSVGTGYGSVVNLQVPGTPAKITTTSPTTITTSSVQSGGSVVSVGSDDIIAKGVCYSTTVVVPNLSNSDFTDAGAGNGSFVVTVADLEPVTSYRLRAYVTTEAGTSYGDVVHFSTYGLPIVSGGSVTNLTDVSATLSGAITADGHSAITERGICYGTSPNPTTSDSKVTNGTGIGSMTCNVSGLTDGTVYYAKAFATNQWGTTYGEEVEFITGMRDIDNNLYRCVKIGSQVWMAENLKVSKYRNGDVIPNVTAVVEWNSLTTGAYCYYDHNPDNNAVYGKLYNWFVVDDSRNVAPTGWHIPTDEEWIALKEYLTNNGYGYGGAGNEIAKSMASTSGWETYTTPGTAGNDQSSNNSSGFSGFPGGCQQGPDFNGFGYGAMWWSSSEPTIYYVDSIYGLQGAATYWFLYYSRGFMDFHINNIRNGYGIRCVRDELI